MATKLYTHGNTGKHRARTVHRNSAQRGRGPRRELGMQRRGSTQLSLGTLLFAWPSFWEGVARIFDFGNTLTEYNRSYTPGNADARALAADWRVVGEDIRAAIAEYDQAPVETVR